LHRNGQVARAKRLHRKALACIRLRHEHPVAMDCWGVGGQGYAQQFAQKDALLPAPQLVFISCSFSQDVLLCSGPSSHSAASALA
jgi:hypothetical protein